MTKPGWGSVVQGEPRDLAEWEHSLKPPFDPWVEKHGNDLVLRSASLDELSDAREVRDLAVAYIERLNGAIALSQGAKPLRFGGAIRFAPDGTHHRTMFAELGAFEVGDALRATLTISGPGREPVSPQPSAVQTWAELAERDELLNDALIYFGRATDWFDIYKALECLIQRFGAGKENIFLALGWASSTEIILLKRTANSARHARKMFAPPPNPMDLKDARALLGKLLQRGISEVKNGSM